MQVVPAQSTRFDDLGYAVVLSVMTVNRFSPGARLLAGLAKALTSVFNVPLEAMSGVAVVRPGALAINPISWTREETLAAADTNAGSVLPVTATLCDLTPIPGLASAQVDTARGVVVCASVDPERFALPGWPKGVYHSYDYPFYFYNLRENAQNRVEKYLAANP